MADDLDEVRAALRSDAEGVAVALLGQPNKRLSGKRTLRFGNNGSVAVEIAGPKRGMWFDHEGGNGSDLLGLIQHQHNCGFPDALAWARRHCGIAEPDDAADEQDRQRREQQDADRRARQAEQEAERAAHAQADEARRIAHAGLLWRDAVPIGGTVAETYLTTTRGIPAPSSGWPDAVRFHPGTRSLIVAATDDDDELRAVQRVRLTEAGRKIDGSSQWLTKETNGVLAGAAVRLPGPADGPLLLAEGPETGLSVWAATGHETHIQLGSVSSTTAPDGRRCIVCRDDDADDSPAARKLTAAIAEWRADGADVLVAWPWPEQRRDKSDFNDTIRSSGAEAVRARIAGAEAPDDLADDADSADGDTPATPHYARPHLSGGAAGRRLRRVVAAWFDRVELHLATRDWITAEAERIEPEVQRQSEARILARLVKKGVDPHEAEEKAAIRAEKAAPRLARRAARLAAVARFGNRASFGKMPRIQIRGAAGLGKTKVVVAEYLRRPALWKRNIDAFTSNLELADDFAADVTNAAAGVAPAPDGSRPRAIVIRGRNEENCARERLRLTRAAMTAGCNSVYRACCHTPAAGNAPETYCPVWENCEAHGYIAQFSDTAPALRVLPHARLGLQQPDEIRLPAADIVIVDESAIGALTTKDATLDPAALSDPMTYAAEPGEEHLIEEAVATGRIVADMLSGHEDAVEMMRAAGVKPEHLRAAATAASLGAEHGRPRVHAGMDAKQARERLESHTPHVGRVAAAVLAQLARDMDAGRAASIGIEWDDKHMARMEDGTRALHPIIRRHGQVPAYGAPSNVALLLLDADADLEINRQLFGGDLRGFTIPAVRQAHVTQVFDAALATSTLAPDERLPNNHQKADHLRHRIAGFIRREVEGGKQVLAMATLPVRRALTDETEPRVPVSVPWCGAEISHFGRHLGADGWRDFDTVAVIGREQLPPVGAERIARAIWANAPGVTLTLPGAYDREKRHHDLRTGTPPAVSVQVHPDPRVQAVVELHREQAIGQAVDRLRLIHRDPSRPARVVVLSNLPVPGIVVDRLMKLNDVLAGGTIWDRAFARTPGGVLPLSPVWLAGNLPDLFTSRRTAEREVASFDKPPLGNIDTISQVAVYRVAGQKRRSKALVRPDVADPRAELARVLGAEIVEFRMAGPSASAPVAAAEEVPQAPAVTPAVEREQPSARPVEPIPEPQADPTAAIIVLGAAVPFDALPSVAPPVDPSPFVVVDAIAPDARQRLRDLSGRLERLRPPTLYHDEFDALRVWWWHERLAAVVCNIAANDGQPDRSGDDIRRASKGIG